MKSRGTQASRRPGLERLPSWLWILGLFLPVLAHPLLTLSRPASASHASVAQRPGSTPPPASAATKGPEAKTKASAGGGCLECHPYDEVSKASASYTTSDGIQVNTHPMLETTKRKRGMASPHASGEGIPDCRECHEAHAQPPKVSEISKANVDYCYGMCHHPGNFTRCGKCHSK
jgi:hypothetical protein